MPGPKAILRGLGVADVPLAGRRRVARDPRYAPPMQTQSPEQPGSAGSIRRASAKSVSGPRVTSETSPGRRRAPRRSDPRRPCADRAPFGPQAAPRTRGPRAVRLGRDLERRWTGGPPGPRTTATSAGPPARARPRVFSPTCPRGRRSPDAGDGDEVGVRACRRRRGARGASSIPVSTSTVSVLATKASPGHLTGTLRDAQGQPRRTCASCPLLA